MGKGALTICGFGMALKEITVETIDAIRNSEVIFSDAISNTEAKAISEWCPDVRDLNALAGEGPHHIVAAKKVEIALQAVAEGKRVTVLNYGHSTFLSTLAQGLIERCRKQDYPYRVLNAVSSLSAVLTQLELTALWTGLHVYDADDYAGLISVVPLQSTIPTIIVKVGYLLKPEQKDRLEPFINRLLEFYPAGYKVELVEAPWIGCPEGNRVETPIEDIGTAIENPHEFLTLYIPPTSMPSRPGVTFVDPKTGLPADIAPGSALFDEGDLKGAEAYFTSLLEKEPERFDALQWRGHVRMSMTHYKEAIEDISRAVERMEEPGWGHQLRAEARFHAGDLDGCLEDVAQASLWSDRGVQVDVLHASVLMMKGDLPGAVKAMDEGIRMGGIDWACRWFWTFNEDLENYQDLEKLIEYAEGRYAIGEHRGFLAIILGNWALEKKNVQKAIDYFKVAIELYPDAEVPRRKLEEAQAAA